MLFLSAGCEDEQIKWETNTAPGMLVVEGSLTNELKQHEVLLSRSADYFINKKTPAVSGANVRVISGPDTLLYREDPDREGLYLSENPVAGQPGRTYTLDIRLQDPINGQKHYQAREDMIRGMVLDTIHAAMYENPLYAEQSPMDSMILYLSAYGEEPKDIRNYYAVNLYRNGKSVRDTIDELDILSDTEELEGRFVNHFFFFESFTPGDTIGLELSTVSKSYRNYVEGIKEIANQSGNPFNLSGPPANAQGNIQGDNALGYFRVSHLTRAQTIVQEEPQIR
ncbi:MAG: DUF4249 domain-containing protein [Bacteroidales bacterium]|nr:DUF4249 domain-containing protein [Bacteroidales bacterium]